MSVSRRSLLLAGGSAVAVAGLPWPVAAATEGADILFFGGPIITVNDEQPSVEAIAVKDGMIVDIGAERDLRSKWAGPNTRLVDLGGRALLPGFIDGHGHFMNAPRIVNSANVTPVPAGPVRAIAGHSQSIAGQCRPAKYSKRRMGGRLWL